MGLATDDLIGEANLAPVRRPEERQQ
jgi:hypothetical protein